MRYFLLAVLAISSLSSQANQVVYETDWITSEEMSVTLNKMNQNRLFPCHIEGKIEGIEMLFRASYCPYLPKMNYFYSMWRMSEGDYKSTTEHYAKYNMSEHFHSTFIDLSGNDVYQATWIRFDSEK